MEIPAPVNIHEQHINITKAIVGKEPIMEAMDDVTEWVNSVWRQFLGYGTAICALVMLMFCMTWCFRRSLGKQGQGPRPNTPVVTYHSTSAPQETTATSANKSKDGTAMVDI